MPPQTLFGTATFGMEGTSFQTPSQIASCLSLLLTHRITHLDTGARYPPGAPGKTETLLGRTLSQHPELAGKFTIDTKVVTPSPNERGDLGEENIRASVAGSLRRLGVESVNVLYAHTADFDTPLLEQIQGFNEQIAKGHCKEWGVCNHSVEHLSEMLRICEEKGLRKPSVYQGDNNVITRGAEAELFPLLRTHGIHFVGFRPIAGGFLTGALTAGNVAGTRFDSATNSFGSMMSGLYKAPELREAFLRFQSRVQDQGLGTVEVALRWLCWHSSLDAQDGVILGASKESQVEQNVKAVTEGPLDETMIDVCQEMWEALRESRAGASIPVSGKLPAKGDS